MKIMISQPMYGLHDSEILIKRDKAIQEIQLSGHEFVDAFINDKDMEGKNPLQLPVYYLAKSLEVMSECEGVYFLEGWETGRACKIEHKVALQYGLKLFYESTLEFDKSNYTLNKRAES